MRSFMVRTISTSFAMLVLTTVSFSQSTETPVRTDALPRATPTPTLQLLYTGKLQGYFRSPNLQSGVSKEQDVAVPCTVSPQNNASPAARLFLQVREQEISKNLILVGTGDNFAPQLEARLFDPDRRPDLKDSGVDRDKYEPANKELYSWYRAENRWVPVADTPLELKKVLERGEGTIPTDNVGCFLSAARFAAVVPGKHDFYFGADRVRQLARFLAGIHQPGYQPVQMLGANLVIKTLRIAGGSAQAPNSKWPEDFSVDNLKPF